MWTLTEAADYLGYSASGLRKLVKRGDVRAFQARKHAPLKFKREWLDDFINANSLLQGVPACLPPAKPRKQKAPPAIDGASEFGFDSALLKL
jgi:hypothetical protein